VRAPDVVADLPAPGIPATVRDGVDDQAAELRMSLAHDGLPHGDQAGERGLRRLMPRTTAVRPDALKRAS
jgi:hypothetical protein